MGVLDDAIREHLELKRLHGADAAEVARQEQEALGPARRGPEPLEVSSPPAAAEPDDADPGFAPDPAYGEPAADEPAWEAEPEPYAAEPQPVADVPVPEPEPAPEPYAPESEPEPVASEPEPEPVLYREPEPRTEPELFRDAEPDPEPEAPSTVDQPTVAFDAADIHDAQRRAGAEPAPASPDPPQDVDEDVLEETPDFLQETPEHDRLWFEQRPPRDFDFDG